MVMSQQLAMHLVSTCCSQKYAASPDCAMTLVPILKESPKSLQLRGNPKPLGDTNYDSFRSHPIGTKVLLRLCYSTLFPLPHFPWGHHKLFECKSLPVVCFWVIQPRCGFSEPQINVHRLSIESWLIFIAVIILEFLIWKDCQALFL